MNEKTRGGFTRGKAEYFPGEGNYVSLATDKAGGVQVDKWWVAEIVNDMEGGESTIKANASLIVAAFNAATEVEDIGFDGLEALKALPEMVRTLEAIEPQLAAPDFRTGLEWSLGLIRAILARLKGESDG